MIPLPTITLFVTLAGELAGSLTNDAPHPRIDGGRPTEPDEYESVVAILAHTTNCSGVMVSPTIMLTAAHCVDDVGFGQHVTMYYGTPTNADRRHQATAWAAHPSYCADCRNDQLDIGYVELTLPYELTDDRFAVPAPQDVWDDLMQEGRTLHAVGYGADDAMGARTQRVAEVALTDSTRSGHELSSEGVDGTTCDGDSGGPLFVTDSSGAQWLVGIHSRGMSCSGTMTATTPYPALCWLREETGLELLPPGTEDCSSFDTGCGGCQAGGHDRLGPGMLLLGVLAIARRRAR